MGIAPSGDQPPAGAEPSLRLLSRVRIPQQVLFRDLGGEAVLLQLESGQYFGLDEVGARMWQLLAKHAEVGVAYRLLLEEFEVEPNQLQADLFKFVDQLLARGLVTSDNE